MLSHIVQGQVSAAKNCTCIVDQEFLIRRIADIGLWILDLDENLPPVKNPHQAQPQQDESDRKR